jgi:hypothetical protein
LQRFNKRLCQLDAGADAVEEKQRRACPISAPNADAQRLPADVALTDLHLFLHHVLAGRLAAPG